MKKPHATLAVVTTTIRDLRTPELKAVIGGVPPDPCRKPVLNPSGG